MEKIKNRRKITLDELFDEESCDLSPFKPLLLKQSESHLFQCQINSKLHVVVVVVVVVLWIFKESHPFFLETMFLKRQDST